MELRNQVAVVTGGGSGIGAAAARRFAEEGARVLIAGRTMDKLEHKFSDIGSTAYSASKAAQLSLTQNLALELAQHRIRVNAICPGSIATSIGEHMEMRNAKATEEVAEYRRAGTSRAGGRAGAVSRLPSRVAHHRHAGVDRRRPGVGASVSCAAPRGMLLA